MGVRSVVGADHIDRPVSHRRDATQAILFIAQGGRKSGKGSEVEYGVVGQEKVPGRDAATDPQTACLAIPNHIKTARRGDLPEMDMGATFFGKY